MLQDKLKHYKIILASGSPRRHHFFKDLNIDFEVRLKPILEDYPTHLKRNDITTYLAQLKAEPYKTELLENNILITSDTIVWHNQKALGKPKDYDDAFSIIKSLSDSTHEVFTGVCFTGKNFQKTVYDTTKVTFKQFTDNEIEYYINTYKPFDKAGAYGIQEWLGQIGVTKIEGSFFNVMGLPIHLVYKTLNELINIKK